MSNPTPDGIVVAQRTVSLRRVFAALIHRTDLDAAACAWLIARADRMHARNAQDLGWYAAEQIRAHAFTDAAKAPATLPAGEATECPFCAFAAVGGVAA